MADINEPLNLAPCRANARRIDYFLDRKQPDMIPTTRKVSPRRGVPKPRRPRRKHHHAAARRFGVAAARGEVPRPDPSSCCSSPQPCRWPWPSCGRQLHRRLHRHPLRHPAQPPAWDFSPGGTPCSGSAELNRVNDEQPVKVRRGGVMREIPAAKSSSRQLVTSEAGRDGSGRQRAWSEAVSLQMDESTLTGRSPKRRSTSTRSSSTDDLPTEPAAARAVVRDGYGAAWSSRPSATPPAGRITDKATIRRRRTPLHRQPDTPFAADQQWASRCRC